MLMNCYFLLFFYTQKTPSIPMAAVVRVVLWQPRGHQQPQRLWPDRERKPAAKPAQQRFHEDPHHLADGVHTEATDHRPDVAGYRIAAGVNRRCHHQNDGDREEGVGTPWWTEAFLVQNVISQIIEAQQKI